MFDFWYDLLPLLRAGMGLLMIGVSVAIFFLTGGRLFAYGLGAVALVLMLFCTAGSDSGGYKF
jgi:hypothetical protein